MSHTLEFYKTVQEGEQGSEQVGKILQAQKKSVASRT